MDRNLHALHAWCENKINKTTKAFVFRTALARPKPEASAPSSPRGATRLAGWFGMKLFRCWPVAVLALTDWDRDLNWAVLPTTIIITCSSSSTSATKRTRSLVIGNIFVFASHCGNQRSQRFLLRKQSWWFTLLSFFFLAPQRLWLIGRKGMDPS